MARYYIETTTTWSYKWVVKKLKKDSELTYDDLNINMLQPTEKQIRRQKMIEPRTTIMTHKDMF